MQQILLSKLKTQDEDNDDHFLNAEALPVRTFNEERDRR